MAIQLSFGTLPSGRGPIGAPKPQSPYRIGVLADFSGRQNRGVLESSEDLAARRLLRVSRDNFDDMMAKLKVQLEVPVGDTGSTATLSFASLDDFHPDQIHDRVEQIADAYDAEEKSALMNSVLHHPDFQALESAWTGLDWLLRRATKSSQVEVMVLDASLAEVAADLQASEDLAVSGLHQLLIDKAVRGPKGEPWAVLVGNYVFDLTGEHADLLGRLAKIVSQTNAPFVTTVNPKVLDKSFALGPYDARAWQALRQLPEATLLGLAVPRFLLRLPYGENTKSVDKFSYEEMPQAPERNNYLWGNPALGCAALLAQAFHKQGWAAKPGAVLDLEDLPIHVFTVDGDEDVTLAEAWLARPQTEQLVKLGIMPFLCVRGKGAIQMSRFLSVAQPAQNQPACDLQGPWSPPGAAAAPQPAAAPAPAAPPKPAPPAAAPAPPPPAPAASAPAPAVDEPPAAAAEEEIDPELAALLKQLEDGA
jgi:type VI secretion system ImpB/VipA family protein